VNPLTCQAAALAGGRGPKWELLDLPPNSTLPAMFCGFEVQETLLVNKMFQKELKAADGSTIILSTGAARASFTNPETERASP